MLNLNNDEYWELTPRELEVLADAHRDALANSFGVVAAQVFNSNRQKTKDKVWMPADFYGASEPSTLPTPKQSPALGNMRAFAAACKGYEKSKHANSTRSSA